MKFQILGRIAGVLAITAGLAACVDVEAEVEVLSETTGKSTTLMTMSNEIYPMLKEMSESGGDEASSDFCVAEGDVLTENADGSATCLSIKEGELASLTEGEDGANDDMSFTVVSPGVVRVVFQTNELTSDVTKGSEGADSAESAQALAMMRPYFEDRTIKIRIKGKKVVESNMTVNGNTAETTLQWTDLLYGKADVPAELFAVIDTN
jgi:hypothetical protein